MSTNPHTAEPPKQRPFQFRLRTLLIVVAMAGVAFWLAFRSHQWLEDHRPVFKDEYYDDDGKRLPLDQNGRPIEK